MNNSKMKGFVLSLQERNPVRKMTGLRYRTNILKCGNYVYPETGKKFSINQRDLDRFVSTFNEMRRDGVSIPVPKDHSLSVSDNTGYVLAMRKKGDYLQADVEFINRKEAENALKGGVSVWIPPEFRNARKSYKRPIMHVSLTSYPMIPDLGKFDLVCAVFTPTKEGNFGMLSQAMQSVMDALTQYMGWEVPETVLNGDDDQAAMFICGLLLGQSSAPTETAEEEGGGNTAETASIPSDVPVELVMSAIHGRRAELENAVRTGRLTPANEALFRQQFAHNKMTARQLKNTEGTFRGIMLGLGKATGGGYVGGNSMTSSQFTGSSVWNEVDRRKEKRSLRWEDVNGNK